MTDGTAIVAPEHIQHSIAVVRGLRVMLDADLAGLYGVSTRALIQAVKRNPERFPEDFMFQLTAEEAAILRSQTVISNGGQGGRRYLPYAFTEQGVAMLSSVLRSPRAVQVNIEIMRAFVQLRALLSSRDELAERVGHLEHRVSLIFTAISDLMPPNPVPSRKPLGFPTREPDAAAPTASLSPPRR
ncbi:MAG: ORF6N domain-containing protein [Chloroflexi bacterium]|nr:ORF6N domain-containing protein [Chloroflexota bacterium]